MDEFNPVVPPLDDGSCGHKRIRWERNDWASTFTGSVFNAERTSNPPLNREGATTPSPPPSNRG